MSGVGEMAGSVETAYLEIRERIIRGTYGPGERITEQEITDSVGVSRTPAREALRRLQAEGFVRIVPNHGAVVSQWAEADVDDIFHLRAMLEPYGAARAARAIDAAGIAHLKQLASEQHEESLTRRKGYLYRIGILNSNFHRSLHGYAASERLNAALNSLIEAPLMLHTFHRYDPEHLVRSSLHHLEIVNALEAHDGEWASAAMRLHILAARSALQPIDAAKPDDERSEQSVRSMAGARLRSSLREKA